MDLLSFLKIFGYLDKNLQTIFIKNTMRMLNTLLAPVDSQFNL